MSQLPHCNASSPPLLRRGTAGPRGGVHTRASSESSAKRGGASRRRCVGSSKRSPGAQRSCLPQAAPVEGGGGGRRAQALDSRPRHVLQSAGACVRAGVLHGQDRSLGPPDTRPVADPRLPFLTTLLHLRPTYSASQETLRRLSWTLLCVASPRAFISSPSSTSCSALNARLHLSPA